MKYALMHCRYCGTELTFYNSYVSPDGTEFTREWGCSGCGEEGYDDYLMQARRRLPVADYKGEPT